MATWDVTSNYYSGQGVVLLGDRDTSSGRGYNFIPVGNVTALKLNVATSVTEHKESQSGSRGIDMRLTTEIKGSLSMEMEHYNPTNLAIALRGSYTSTTGSTVTGETNKGYIGRVSSLVNANVSSVAVKRGATALTAYVNDSTAWDYKLNTDAGSFMLNDGSVTALDKLTTGGSSPSITGVTAGATTTLTVTTTAAVGSKVALSGFTGADAALINSKAFTILTNTGTAITIDLNSAGKTITLGTPLSFFDGTALTVDYTYGAQTVIGALTEAATEKFLRFEGLNTANNNKPVIIEVYRFLTDPLKELDMISDTLQKFTLEGNMLMDALQADSKYFRQIMV